MLCSHGVIEIMEKSRWAALLVLAALSGVSKPVLAQDRECESDEDCGFGFHCYHSAGTSGTTAGGSVCGNDFCEYPENPETCPEDCDRYTFCIPNDCDPNSAEEQCADGYECAEDVSLGSTSTGGAPFCGDLVCNGDEDEDSCPDDCATTYSCQVEYRTCESDDDCADGFYCDIPSADESTVNGSTDTAGTTTTSVSTTVNVVTAATLTTGSSGTGIGGAGAQSPPNAEGVCHLEGTTSGGSATNGNSTDGASSASGSTGNVSSTTSASAGTGTGTTGQGGGNSSASGSGSDSASADGAGTGGAGGNSSGSDGGGSGGAAGADGSDGLGGFGAVGSDVTSTGGASDTLGSTATTSPSDSSGSVVSGATSASGGSGGNDDISPDTDNDAGCACGIAGPPSLHLVSLLLGLVGVGWLRRRQR